MAGAMRITRSHYLTYLASTCRFGLLVAVVCGAFLSTGCGLMKRSSWRPPEFARPGSLATATTCNARRHRAMGVSYEYVDPVFALAAAEGSYARGDAQRKAESPCCVDSFFEAAASGWRYLEWSADTPPGDSRRNRAWQLYHSSLARLIETAQKFGRLNPSGGLSVKTPGGMLDVPVAYHGFAWQPSDFNSLVLVGDYRAPDLSHKHRHVGLGVPLVAIRQRQHEERFRGKRQYFAATAVLRRVDQTSSMVLEFYNPLESRFVAMGRQQFHLKTDTTAPLALLLKTRKRDFLEEFLQPGRSLAKAKLIMVQPYQPGKIPLVFVHGLLSDPLTWLDMANEIQAHPDLFDRYQIWAFKYPTGEPFLRSAATLRAELRAALDTFDPQRNDPAMSHMILVGHSMGGLISKLQVTYSGDSIWKSSANRPLETIAATDAQREKLRKMFFFDPAPGIKRVVFIGTPHKGSPWANRPIGRLGSLLVREGQQQEADHEKLVRNNPNTFSDQASKRIPTSVDLLEPGNPILVSIQHLCVNPATRLHSIIGTGRPMLRDGPADGIVPVSSARCGGVDTECFVPTKHTELASHPTSIREIVAILSRHLSEFEREQKPASAATSGEVVKLGN